MTDQTIKERLIRLETLINIIHKNELPHIREDIKQLRNWLWGLFGVFIGYMIYCIVRDFLL